MMRPLVLALAVIAATAGCGATTATQEPVREAALQADAALEPAAIAVPENPVDRGIRRELILAITRDGDLKDRDISFIVANGDVNVTGTVKTEEERRKINDLAMNIDGVKSVANALRVAE